MTSKAQVAALIDERSAEMKNGLASVMYGCEPVEPALRLSGSFYSLVYGMQAFDLIRGVSPLNVLMKVDLNKQPEHIPVVKQEVILLIHKLRQRLDDYEQFVRTV